MGSLSSCSWVCGSPMAPWKDTLRGRARHSSFQKSDDGVCVGQEGDELCWDHHKAKPSPTQGWGRLCGAQLALPSAGSSAKARAVFLVWQCAHASVEKPA